MDLVAGPPDDQVFAEQAGGDRASAGKILDAGHGMPILDEDWVVDHALG